MATHSEIVEALFKELPVDPVLKEFLGSTDVTKEYYLWAGQIASVYSAKLIEVGLAKHADALVQSGKASEKYAASVARATWVLAVATIFLAYTSYLLARHGP
jgi:hypothetical protein